jgi:flagellar basal body rod protein FlgG
MQRIFATAASGLDAAQQRVSAVSHNLANLGTDRFRRQTVVSTADSAGGVQTRVATASQPGAALEEDMVDLLAARHAFAANLAVFRSADRLAGALIDERA